MKKQLYLFTDIFPFKGGEPFLETEILYLSKAFQKVSIFVLNPNETIIALPNNVEVVKINFNPDKQLRKVLLNNFSIFIRWFFHEIIYSPHRIKYITQFKPLFYQLIGRVIKAEKLIDYIALNEVKNATYYSYWFNEWGSILSIMHAKNPQFNFKTRVHLFDFEEEFQDGKFIPFRYTEIKQPKDIIAISNYAKKYLSDRMQIKTGLSYLGVRSAGINNIQTDKPFVIVTCSSLTWYKRPLLLVSLMCQFKTNIKWVHFGSGTLQSEFLEAAEALPTNIDFHFMNHVPNQQIMEYYRENPVHMLLNVSSFEGIPVSLMEAISFGIPVVGCNVCGMPEIITAESGLLLEKDFELERTVAVLQDFLETKCTDSIYRQGVRNFWLRNFNADNNYPQFINQYLLN
jgi:glycosyltransferase involved in cell wall biosynthesis